MKILYIRPYEKETAVVQAAFPEHEVITAECIQEIDESTRTSIEVLSVFVDYQVTKDMLDLLPNLQFIAARSAGYDHIDTTETQARGITISRVPHYGARTVAEYAIALMFALSRNAFRSYTDMQRHAGTVQFTAYEGFDLCGKTLGVVGTGIIGKSVCQIAKGIGMNVIAFDAFPDEDFAAATGVTYDSLDEVLAQADIVTLHVPSLPTTYHMIGAAELALMKPGSYLINTARGEIVDTPALVQALQTGQLAGAGLDVLEGEHELREEVDLLAAGDGPSDLWETLVADHALIDMPNVIVTPHIAFNTVEAKREITDITVANIAGFASGTLQNTVEYG
jgi:D-lactate dehydrogenase